MLGFRVRVAYGVRRQLERGRAHAGDAGGAQADARAQAAAGRGQIFPISTKSRYCHGVRRQLGGGCAHAGDAGGAQADARAEAAAGRAAAAEPGPRRRCSAAGRARGTPRRRLHRRLARHAGLLGRL